MVYTLTRLDLDIFAKLGVELCGAAVGTGVRGRRRRRRGRDGVVVVRNVGVDVDVGMWV